MSTNVLYRSNAITYDWNIKASIARIDALIISGYYRQNFSANVITVITEMIQKFVNLEYSGVPFGQYTLYDIKSVPQNFIEFMSPMFVTGSLTFYLKILKQSTTKWKFQIHLATPCNGFKCNFLLNLKQLNMSQFGSVTFNDWCRYREVKFDKMSVNDIQPLHELTIQFIKQHTTKNVIVKSIQLPILRYSWYISNAALIRKIKCDHQHKFMPSQQFSFGKFKFYLALRTPKSDGNISVDVVLCSMPSGMGQIMVRYKLFLREENVSASGCVSFHEYKLKNTILKRDQQTVNCETIAFFLQMTVYEASTVKYKNGDVKYSQVIPHYIEQFALSSPKCNALIPAQYVWDISNLQSNARNMHGITSNIFKSHLLKWYITMYANGINAESKSCVILLTLASQISIGFPISVLCMFHILELDFKWRQMINLNVKNCKLLSTSQPRINTKDIADYSCLSIKVSFEMVVLSNIVSKMHDGCNDVIVPQQHYIWTVKQRLLAGKKQKKYYSNHKQVKFL